MLNVVIEMKMLRPFRARISKGYLHRAMPYAKLSDPVGVYIELDYYKPQSCVIINLEC